MTKDIKCAICTTGMVEYTCQKCGKKYCEDCCVELDGNCTCGERLAK